ncbi:recombinase family protein [Nocardioides ultimimeridianus]
MNETQQSGRVVGYVRVSSAAQNPARQYEALGDVSLSPRTGKPLVFEDRVSGKTADRPGLDALLEYVREGDTVRVASMDRLARNLLDLRGIVTDLTEQGVSVEFVKEGQRFGFGARDASATLLLNIMGAVAEFERELISERQKEGIALAKQRGVYKGRVAALKPEQVTEARRLVDHGVPKSKIARDLGVSRATLYSALSGTGTYAA